MSRGTVMSTDTFPPELARNGNMCTTLQSWIWPTWLAGTWVAVTATTVPGAALSGLSVRVVADGLEGGSREVDVAAYAALDARALFVTDPEDVETVEAGGQAYSIQSGHLT